jgi:hypothetical protein
MYDFFRSEVDGRLPKQRIWPQEIMTANVRHRNPVKGIGQQTAQQLGAEFLEDVTFENKGMPGIAI